MQLLDRFGPEPQVAAPAVSLDEALAYVRGLASTHYENFSVLSSLVPRELRDDFAAVYAYCRWSDDLADETGADDAARARSEALLAWWRGELERCFADPAGYGEQPGAHPVFTALAQTVRRHGLPAAPFHHLLDAFVQDQRVTRYQTWDELLGYCRGSANPVGRIVLHLGGYPDTPENAERYAMSDAICTALQLTNFWQDVRRDLLERDRVYMPTFETGLAAETLRHWAEHGRDVRMLVSGSSARCGRWWSGRGNSLIGAGPCREPWGRRCGRSCGCSRQGDGRCSGAWSGWVVRPCGNALRWERPARGC
jgi:squalene synthase HpnC